MKERIATLASCLLILTFTLAGCGGTTRIETTNSVTLGQELIDLDKAYKDGVITEKEYKEAKKSVLEKYE